MLPQSWKNNIRSGMNSIGIGNDTINNMRNYGNSLLSPVHAYQHAGQYLNAGKNALKGVFNPVGTFHNNVSAPSAGGSGIIAPQAQVATNGAQLG
jgi:hypothetical protein